MKPSHRFEIDAIERLNCLKSISSRVTHPKNALTFLAKSRTPEGSKEYHSALKIVSKSKLIAAGANHLNSAPFDWFRPTEPQMTYALKHQLDHKNKAVRLARTNALFAACTKAMAIPSSSHCAHHDLILDKVNEIAAEKITKAGKFIDLLISGSRDGRPVELLIEAKLGHFLTDKQLEAYTVDDRGCSARDTVLVVTAPSLTSHDAGRMAEATAARDIELPWKFIDLRTLLLEYSCALQPEFDDAEFARVRRSI